jgi:peroxiredoxin
MKAKFLTHYLPKLGFLVVCLVTISFVSFAQVIDKSNIESHYKYRVNHAVILDSTEKKIDLKDIYEDIRNGKLLLMPAKYQDTTVYMALKTKSQKFYDLLIKQLDEAKASNQKKIGKTHTDFEFTDMEGNKHKLSDFKGKVVVLNYWFIGCKPCHAEIPDLNKLVEEYKEKEVVFIAFANDSKDKLQKFLETNVLNYQLIPNSYSIAQTNTIVSFPANVIIDKQMKMVYFGGTKSGKVMERIIDRSLKE